MLLICATGWMCGACYDDKGNYDYTELSEVRIDTAGLGIPAECNITRFERMILAPNVYYNGKLVNDDANAPLDYYWTIYSSTGIGTTDFVVDTVCRERVLDAEITRAPAAYQIQLEVCNRETNLKKFLQIACTVEGAIPTSGWMVLYECADKPGTSDVGLVYNSLTKKSWYSDDLVYWNLYSSSNGVPMEGKPVRVIRTVKTLPNDVIVLVTEKEMNGVNAESFNRELTFNDFFYEAPSTVSLGAYSQGGYMSTTASMGETIINGNKLYVGAGSRPVGVPMIGTYGELAPWLCLCHNGFSAVVYDQMNGCFLGVANGVKLTSMVAQNPDAAFDVNNVGAVLLMSDWGYGNREYFLMKKDNGYYFASANFFGGATNASMGTGWYDITSSPEIANATTMAVAYQGLYMMYGAGNSVYNLFYTMNQTADKLWEAPSTDEVVTCVQLQKFDYMALHMAMLPNPNAVLHIATWNEKTKEGKLYQYAINAARGALVSDPKVYTVPGKVKDMGWKYVLGI